MKFTSAQLAAMNVRDRTLLVSAAAGSGKTFTLTQRIIKSIIEDGKDISKILIVTFTRAAAGELKEKVSKALTGAIEENPDNAHLQSQFLKLGSAHISTIDSFFSDPVRTNFEKLGLPASMRLSDEAELEPLRNEVMRAVLSSYFDACDELSDGKLSRVGVNNGFTELMSMISAARNSSSIVTTLLEIYKKLTTSPEGVGQLRKHSERMRRCAELDFFETDEGKCIKEEMLSVVNFAAATFLWCCKDMEGNVILNAKYVPCFTESYTSCIALAEAIKNGSYDEVRTAFDNFAPSRIPALRGDNKTDEAEYYKDVRSSLNSDIKDLKKKYLINSGEELANFFLESAEKCDLICEIVEKFEKAYSAEKLSRAICEFSDMPKFMLRLLQNEDGTPTEYADTLASQFDEVYIDEYQDVNEIQDRIFELIGRSHRFMVGDIKQSIYGFREAEPSIFADYRRRFAEYQEQTDISEPIAQNSGNTVFMSNNFRCDENIIKFTNKVCSKIFSAFAESIGYTSSDDLIFTKAKPFEDYISHKVHLNIIQKPVPVEEADAEGEEVEEKAFEENPDKLYDEAVIVANEISRLVREDKKADGTPIQFKDIAILIRSHAASTILASVMGQMNIPYSISAKNEFLDGRDMKLLVDLLSAIDNPRADVPLCNILSAPINGSPILSLEEIITVRRASPSSKSLYDAILDYHDEGSDKSIEQKCARATQELDLLRRVASTLSADKLLRHLCQSELFAKLCQGDAYNYLYDCACRYVRQSWNGLYNFLVYFKRLVESGDGGGEGAGGNADAVTVMTIHQSKGLEFPVCFLFATNKQFNLMDSRSPVIFSKDFGLSMKLPPKHSENTDVIEKIRVRHKENVLWRAADLRIKRRQIEEEARIFYVALTRARERLYLSATLNTTFDEYIYSLSRCADTFYEIKKGKSYVRQTILALAADLLYESDVFKLNVYTKGECAPVDPFTKEQAVINGEIGISDEERSLLGLMNLSATRSEEERLLANIPAKVAASKVSSTMLDDSVFSPIPTGILFSEGADDQSTQGSDSAVRIKNRIDLMRSKSTDFDSLLDINKKPTAAERGTAMHQFLQFCDYENVAQNGIEGEIERLRALRFITQRTADIIDKRMLKGFVSSELFNMVRNAKNLHREFKFGLFRPAEDFTESAEMKLAVHGKKIYVQGSVDLLIEAENGDIFLCDYKTDRISEEEREDRSLLQRRMREKHLEQLKEYSYAIEQIFGKAPAKMFIYSATLGEVIEM